MAESYFMVIIVDPDTDMVKLLSRFTRTHGRLLRNPVTLRRRDHIEWVVQIENTDGEIWLTTGWKGFAILNDIKSKYVLLFDYGGHSNFAVTIYHFAAVEVPHPNYPLGAAPAKFFKCISKAALLQELKFPEQFNMLFADKLSNPLSLTPGVGTNWKVYWRISGGHICLYRGWADAAAHLSLSVRDFCLFTYHGNSIITITVCADCKGQVTYFARRMAEFDDDIEPMQQMLWTTEVTKYIISKTKPLYIPAAVVRTHFKNKLEEIEVRIPSGAVQKWSLIWSGTRTANEGYLGRGWYDFVVQYPLALNQTVRFFRNGNEAIIHVEVI